MHLFPVVIIFKLAVNAVKWLVPKEKTLALSQMIELIERLASSHLKSFEYFRGLNVRVQFQCWPVNDVQHIIHLILLLFSIVLYLLHHICVPVIIIEHVIVVRLVIHVIFQGVIATLIGGNLSDLSLHHFVLILRILLHLALLFIRNLVQVIDLDLHSLVISSVSATDLILAGAARAWPLFEWFVLWSIKGS